MKKEWELQNIDDFIKDFNKIFNKKLVRISDETQENPDAICLLDQKIKIGLEATIAIAPKDRPGNKKLIKTKPEDYIYNAMPVIRELIKLINKKSLNDYKFNGCDQVWLLISGGSYISTYDLEDVFKTEKIRSKFDRTFIHKGIGEMLIEL